MLSCPCPVRVKVLCGKCQALDSIKGISTLAQQLFGYLIISLTPRVYVPVQILREYNLCGKCWGLDGVDAIGPFTELVSPDAPNRYSANMKARLLLKYYRFSCWIYRNRLYIFPPNPFTTLKPPKKPETSGRTTMQRRLATTQHFLCG